MTDHDISGHHEVPPVSIDEDGFDTLGLRPELLKAISDLGYEEPTPIQREAIPPLLAGRDLLGQAATGTGKTAAFALPILQRLDADGARSSPFALVLVPTRELADAGLARRSTKYGRELGAQVAADLRRPADRPPAAGAATAASTSSSPRPGRALDHIGRGTLPLDAIAASVVLDEADEMLDMGFAEDIEAILAGDARRAARPCCSRPRCRRGSTRIARRHLQRPGAHPDRPRRHASRRGAAGAPERLRRAAGRTSRPRSGRILDVEAPTAALVFCRTRTEVDQLTETLNGRGYRAEALHGGMNQEQRDRVMGRLRDGTADLLVATDVAARGLDIDTLTHVVNYDVPSAAESYVHRIGRVGRAGREGVAITLAEPREHRLLQHRAAHQAEDRHREGADGRRPARPPARADRRPPFARRWPPTTSTTTTTCSTRLPTSTTSARSRWPR